MKDPRHIKIEDFNYPLPDERIAKHPLAVRDACKLLVTNGNTVHDHIFNELPALLPDNAVMVCNNTRVINARLRFKKSTGAIIEVFASNRTTPLIMPRPSLHEAGVNGNVWLEMLSAGKKDASKC